MKRRALSTSLWGKRMAARLLLKKKTKGICRMNTNTITNQEYQPLPPVQFLTKNLHVAECPQMWTLQIHPSLSLQTAHDVHKAISFTGFLGPTITCFDFIQRSPLALFSLPDDQIQIGEKLQKRDYMALRNTLVNCQFSLVTGDTPSKGGCYPDLFFNCTQYFQ